MKMPPPKLVRKLVIGPLFTIATLLAVLASPVLLVVAALVSLVVGGWRAVRMVWLAIVYLVRNSAATIGAFGLWIASGFGRRLHLDSMRRAHYALVRWFLTGLYKSAVRVANVRVETHDSEPAEAALREHRRPVLVMSRHAGAGDSFLLVYFLLCRYKRRPRVVMHHGLRVDPLIDLFGSRVPNRFIDPRGGSEEDVISTLASGLEHDGALVIFPEGGNVTASRRRKAIERLEQAGRTDKAAQARRMTNVMPPRPRGALDAIAAAPDADVIFVAHIGFPCSFGELWRDLPVKQTVDLRLWHAPREEIPSDRDGQVDWLFDWWEEIDGWIECRRPERARAGEPQPARVLEPSG